MKPLDDEARRLIADASAADTPTPELEAELWQRLAPRLRAPLPASAAAASQTPAAAAGLSLKVIAGALAVGALAMGVQHKLAMTPTAAEIAPQRHALELQRAQPTASPLLEEAQLLGQAQHALSGADPTRALMFIERHRARFPHGALVQEREAARVFALCALGESEPARAAQQHFLQVWPGSLLAERVRAACPKVPATPGVSH